MRGFGVLPNKTLREAGLVVRWGEGRAAAAMTKTTGSIVEQSAVERVGGAAARNGAARNEAQEVQGMNAAAGTGAVGLGGGCRAAWGLFSALCGPAAVRQADVRVRGGGPTNERPAAEVDWR